MTVIAIVLFCATGVAAMLGWLPASWGTTGKLQGPAVGAQAPAQAGKLPPPRSSAPAAAGKGGPTPDAVALNHRKCAECGVVESIREIEVKG